MKNGNIFTKTRRYVVMITLLLIIIGFSISVVFIVDLRNRDYFNEKFKNYSYQLSKIRKDINTSYIHLMNTSNALHNAINIIDNLVALTKHYHKIGEFGHFYKLNKTMNYKNGQSACRNVHGHIIEFDERNPNYKDKLSGNP